MSEVEGATSESYTLAAADFAKTVKVRVSFTDRGLGAETLTSEAVGPVANNAPPSAPQNLAVTSESAHGVSLAWELPVQGDVGGYRVLRRVRSGSGDFEEVGETDPLVTSYTDDTVTAGVTYLYRVEAFNVALGTATRRPR